MRVIQPQRRGGFQAKVSLEVIDQNVILWIFRMSCRFKWAEKTPQLGPSRPYYNQLLCLQLPHFRCLNEAHNGRASSKARACVHKIRRTGSGNSRKQQQKYQARTQKNIFIWYSSRISWCASMVAPTWDALHIAFWLLLQWVLRDIIRVRHSHCRHNHAIYPSFLLMMCEMGGASYQMVWKWKVCSCYRNHRLLGPTIQIGHKLPAWCLENQPVLGVLGVLCWFLCHDDPKVQSWETTPYDDDWKLRSSNKLQIPTAGTECGTPHLTNELIEEWDVEILYNPMESVSGLG